MSEECYNITDEEEDGIVITETCDDGLIEITEGGGGSSGGGISCADVPACETDPVYSADPASGITAPDIVNWDTAFSWGDHAGLYSPINLVECISLQDSTTGIVAQTYTLELYAEYPYNINELRIIAGAGTATAAIQIDGVSVTGISAVAVSNVIALGTATALFAVAIGQKVTLVITAPTGLNNLQATLKATRI